MTYFSCNALKYASMSNQECKVRPAIINIDSNEPLFYAYCIVVNKCRGSCNDINNPYPKLMKQDRYLGMKLVHVNVD